jgi:cytochrome c-type biogenesis protein CcmF
LASRETALIINNILLAVASFVVFIGTIWPLVAEAFWQRKLSVGAPFFDAAFTPFFVCLAIILPVGAMMPWKRAKVGTALRKLLPSIILSVAVLALVYVVQTGKTLLGPIGLGLGVWLVAGAMQDIASKLGRNRDLSRLLRLPRADWGRLLAHGGLGVTIAGIAGLTAWTIEDIRVVQIGERFDVASYTLVLDDVARKQGPNYITTMADITLLKGDTVLATLHPEKRNYPVAQMPTTEAGIDSGLLRDVYVVIGDVQSNGGYAVRTYIKPMANWIWGGTIIMALGGFMSLTDRRYRVAAGARKAKLEPKGVPAE